MSEKNPIEMELAKLDEQWEEFVSSEAPIFRWSLKPDALRLANTFVKVKEQFDDDASDLFITLSSSFTKGENFAFDLAEEMNSLLDEGFKDAKLQEKAEGDTEDKNDIAWHRPDLSAYTNGFQALFESAQKILDALGEYIDLLVLPIMPTQASNIHHYLAWWDNCARIHRDYSIWPEKLKLIVFENCAHPLLQEPADHYPDQIFSLTAPSDMKSALNKILDGADDGSPGAKIRREIATLNYAIGEQDQKTMEASAERALHVAQENNFFDMLATVHMMRAAGYLNMQQFDKSINDYRAAQNFAAEGKSQEVLGCDKLFMQSCMLEGTALFNAKQYDQAADAYERAAKTAQAQQDKLMTLEGWRMASFSLEQNKQTKMAWDKGIQAMEAGKNMTEDERQQSTLAFVGDALMRLSPDSHTQHEVQESFNQLIGPEWLENLRKETA